MSCTKDNETHYLKPIFRNMRFAIIPNNKAWCINYFSEIYLCLIWMVCRVIILYYNDIAVDRTNRYYNVHNNIIFASGYRSISIHIIIIRYTYPWI